MSVTINAFPPFHEFKFSRSWFLACIVLLHVAFFWALSNGLSLAPNTPPKPPLITDFRTAPPKPPARPRDIEPVEISPVYVPTELPPQARIEEFADNSLTPTPPQEGPVAEPSGRPGTAEPMVQEPRIDPRRGLTEPVYPSTEIRLHHGGTVVLSVRVLENGRIGEVRIEQSSGYPRLDESAVREARRWRLIPGMRDGAPVAMWKRIPVTFRLQD